MIAATIAATIGWLGAGGFPRLSVHLGVPVLIALVVLLLAAELLRILHPRAAGRLRALDLVAVPLLVVLAALVVGRFVALA